MSRRLAAFNGGPGNCPAKHRIRTAAGLLADVLQWRAGQLPGQTTVGDGLRDGAEATFNGGPGNCPAKQRAAQEATERAAVPSMEGRAIARPNPMTGPIADHIACLLQWRAGQLPGQTFSTDSSLWVVFRLQWRAGQLPGQTSHVPGAASPRRAPSMEGRAIARPNRARARPSRGTE